MPKVVRTAGWARSWGRYAAAATVVAAAYIVAPVSLATARPLPPTYTVPDPPPVDIVQHSFGTDEASFAPGVLPMGDPGGIHPVVPSRLLDTRAGAKPAAGALLAVTVAGHGGVPPAGADAVVLTVTVTAPDAPGFVTAYPCGGARPGVSNVNFGAGDTVANLATVPIAADGTVCLFTSAPAHLVTDVSAWYGAGPDHAASVVPARIADTRTNQHKLGAGQVLVVHPGVAADVPDKDVHAVALNVTATEPGAAGFLTVYPCDAPRPTASNLNYTPGEDTADAVIVGVAGDGSVCVFSSADTHVVVDVNGWFGPLGLARFNAAAPQRITDTRTTSKMVSAGGVLTVPIPDKSASVVVLNVTATGGWARGYVTAYPCGLGRPLASSLNFGPGETVANAAVIPVGAGGVCFFASEATHLVVDLDGAFQATYSGSAPVNGSALPALQWGFTQVGKPYAAINPYRFGDSIYGKPWACDDGSNPCTRVDMHGTSHTYPAGTIVYDCSGFVTAAWLRAGVDLVKANAAWTDAMLDHLKHVATPAAQPGDIVLFNYSGGGDETNSRTDHAGMFLTTTTMLQAGNSGVSVATIDWTKVVAVVRPGA